MATLSRSERLAAAVDKAAMLIEAIEQTGTGRRREPSLEVEPEDAQLGYSRRLTGVALGRDLQRNVAPFVGLMRQFETAAVGAAGPVLQPSPPQGNAMAADWCSAAAEWFSRWCDWCDGQDDTPFAELVSQAMTAGFREGDLLWVFDDFDRDDGSLRIYEADQLVSVDAKDWEAQYRKSPAEFPWREPDISPTRQPSDPRTLPMIQKDGVIRDRRGRVHGYIVCADHGRGVVKWEYATAVGAWSDRRNPRGSAKLYKHQWRRSYRGSPAATVFAPLQHDVYEMVSHALQSAKRAHQMAGWTETDVAANTDPVEQALLRAGIDPDKVMALAEQNATEGSTIEVDNLNSLLLNRNYENMEKLTGGYWEYPNPGEKIHLEASDQPGPNMEPFADWCQSQSGYSLGLGRSRSLGHAAQAYTAFRGEELMSWAAFAYEQSRIERRLLGFAVAKAIGWAIRKGELTQPPAGRWQDWWRWQWPSMPEVDQLKSATALRMQMKLGSLSFADLIGPNWETYLRDFGRQLEVAREADLPVSMLETVAGAMAVTPADTSEADAGSNQQPDSGSNQ